MSKPNQILFDIGTCRVLAGSIIDLIDCNFGGAVNHESSDIETLQNMLADCNLLAAKIVGVEFEIDELNAP